MKPTAFLGGANAAREARKVLLMGDIRVKEALVSRINPCLAEALTPLKQALLHIIERAQLEFRMKARRIPTTIRALKTKSTRGP